ncbi:hypothetical protein D3Z45_17575 [Lachnospiraceae bacterium]|nr:hypothetical protein [Lachnospiraceae bacterium]
MYIQGIVRVAHSPDTGFSFAAMENGIWYWGMRCLLYGFRSEKLERCFYGKNNLSSIQFFTNSFL